MNFLKLRDPFAPTDIEWRLQSAGEKNGRIWAKVLAYVTNRAIQDRLDEVVGPPNWRNEYTKAPEGGVLCGISIKIDGEWVTKWDGAENTDIEAVKGGLSSAMKRAAVQWGIGRYLYNLEEGFAVIHEQGSYSGRTKESAKGKNDGKWFKWDPPTLPNWALPNYDGTPQPVDKKTGEVFPASPKQREVLERLVSELAGVPDIKGKDSKAIHKASVLVEAEDLDADTATAAIGHLEALAKQYGATV